jgi:hypothetical protein
VNNALLTEVRDFLATDAQRSPWHCLQAPPAYFTITVHTRAERTVLDSKQSGGYATANRGCRAQSSDRDLSHNLMLGFLDFIGASLNRDAF